MQERRNCKGALVPSWHCERGIGVWHLWTGAGRAASESGNGTEGKYRHRAKRRFYYFSNLTPTYVFLFLNFAVRILPYVLNIIVVFLARRLLAAMKEDLYQEESVKLAEKLSHFCVWTLASTIGLGAVFNLLQLFFQSSLYQIEYVVAVPVFSLAFVLAVLLFAKYIREMQRLKEDNDLFI